MSSSSRNKTTTKSSSTTDKTSDSLASTFKIPKSNVKNAPFVSDQSFQNILQNAAIKIQRWYRRHMARKRTSKAAIQRLLLEKKKAIEQKRTDPSTSLPTVNVT